MKLREVSQPTPIVRSDYRQPKGAFDMSGTATRADIASYFPDARDIVLEDSTHFIPMERPGYVPV